VRIISKFRDYYDGVQRQGFDRDLVYVRKEEDSHVIVIPNLPYNFWLGEQELRNAEGNILGTMEWRFCPVVFCGKFYPRFKAWRNGSVDYYRGVTPLIERFADTAKEARAMVRDALGAVKPVQKYRRLPDERVEVLLDALQRRDWGKDHQQAKAPLLSLRPWNEKDPGYSRFQYDTRLMVTTNPNLEDSGFQAIVDPFTAYQEIAMYMGGVLATSGNPMVTLSDKERIAKQGFDKWSFRKPPTKGMFSR
jgi:hypothetical protein